MQLALCVKVRMLCVQEGLNVSQPRACKGWPKVRQARRGGHAPPSMRGLRKKSVRCSGGRCGCLTARRKTQLIQSREHTMLMVLPPPLLLPLLSPPSFW
jgi:hypothetical protein